MSLTTYVNINFSNYLATQTPDEQKSAVRRLKAYLESHAVRLGYPGAPLEPSELDLFLNEEGDKLTWKTVRVSLTITEGNSPQCLQRIVHIGEIDAAIADVQDAIKEDKAPVYTECFKAFLPALHQIKLQFNHHVIAGHLTPAQERDVQSFGFITVGSPYGLVP